MIDFLYGTAWKEEETAECVLNALRAGFRSIDTANQRKHYYEEGVGKGLASGMKELGLKREDIFLQTKFTYRRGQDERLPYDPQATVSEQVQQSFRSSLEHLGVEQLDSLILHGPHQSQGIDEVDQETWESMESLVQSGGVRYLGISNTSLEQLEELYSWAKIKPVFVQNRCFAHTGWDKEIREFCRSHEMHYQGFSLLTANREFLAGQAREIEGRRVPKFEFSSKSSEYGAISPELKKMMESTGKTLPQVIFKFCQQVQMIPITGTRTPESMRLNLELSGFELNADELSVIENIAH